MKKIFALLLSLAICIISAARTITEEEAFKYAGRFFNDTQTSEFTLVWTGSDSSNPAFYAFNRKGGGFVIISSEDATAPILGYSYTGEFKTNGMPVNLKGWFGIIEKDIVRVRKDKLVQNSEVKAKWETIGVRTKGGEDAILLQTAEWDQSNPYNLYCDLPDGKKAVTGCVATAMAIYMRYLEYPAHGTGHLNGYRTSTKGYQIDGYDIDDHIYDWKSMPLSRKDVMKAGDAAKKQIAQIMHDCGVSVRMDYTQSSSGTQSSRIADALINHFGFSAGTLEYERCLYDYSVWASMLRNELEENRPIIYGAQDYNGQGGHQFIIDGFDGKGQWHVNWGWSGSDNGYFTIDLEIPGSYAFSAQASAILGAIPDPEGTKGEKSSMIFLDNQGIKLVSGTFATGVEFEINPNYIANRGIADYKGKAVPALVSKDGTVIEKISEPQDLEIQRMSGASYYAEGDLKFICRTDKTLNFGDAVMMMYLVPGTEDEYVLMPYNHDGTRGKLTAIPLFIKKDKSSYSEGDIFDLVVEGGFEPISSVKWYYDGTLVKGYVVRLTKGTHEIKAVVVCGGKTYNIIQEISVN